MIELLDQEDLVMGTQVEIMVQEATVVTAKEMVYLTATVVHTVQAVINMAHMVLVVAMEITTAMEEQVTEACKKVSVNQFCLGCYKNIVPHFVAAVEEL